MPPSSPYLSLLLLGAMLSPAPRPKHKVVPLPLAVGRILADPSVSQAHWGVSVVALSGNPIYKLNDNQYFNPASNAKMFTTATAYALLPSGLTFTTLVSATAPVGSAGEVGGDITIFGVGDPNISGRTMPFGLKTERTGPPLAALEDMADQIVRHGVHSVTGDIVGDDTWLELG
jgi:D-alanyl-D-alanine carboxypeptidase/D-alanyl-D-alanine-endopeptidase (penicillin-binding protein 4)